MFNWVKFWWSISEDEKWNNLETKLKEVMFGQHIAVGEVLSCLRTHFANKNPRKALVIICNGSLGTGKTYFANMMVKTILDSNQKRTCVKLFVGPRDFPDSELISTYKEILRKEIETQVKKYPNTFFIFDEVDKMPTGLLDVISPYVDKYEKLGGVDFRKCVFLFLSNTGGQKIDEIVMKQSIDGKNREDLLLFHFRKELENIVFNETGGLQGSAIISKKLIDHYVPFLPLEKSHIIQCLEVEYKLIEKTFNTPPNLNEVAELFDYYPNENPVFSEEGAKNVYIKILHAREFINKGIPIPHHESRTAETVNLKVESTVTGVEEVIDDKLPIF